MNKIINLPQNLNLVVCPVCCGKNHKSIFGELLKDACGIKVRIGPTVFSLTGQRIYLNCNFCGTTYIFLGNDGIYPLQPLGLPPEITAFYAIKTEVKQ